MLKGKKIKGIQREIAMLPQDVETLLVADTVKRELELAGAEGKEFPFDLKPYYDRHPYDLSGGEKQMLALAKVMAKDASIVLMDEPAKGLDKESCDRLIDFIHFLKKNGKTVLIVTHDVEFAALCADRCAFFFRGEIVAEDNVGQFFEENTFYTTAASRMSKDIFENVITTKDLLDRCSALGGVE